MKNDPTVLANLNIVQEFKSHPLKATKLAYSYIKRTLFSRHLGSKSEDPVEATARSVVDLE